ncbi:FadR/GntR family transcriptional regulator [Microlunatus soli]|uniref:DNA-binding transcriptional regulator, FadR family n=1 Tax=Microlunatus soli TaxID=630515 RepID=A0A1H1QNR6_9ACTN|nr:FadR/GntR family transcriptional regulator [Microlunatus soli]SDS25016.1 DNA-binding transcriptional regulator, FadR family [Microlunatus soli]
MAVTDEAIERLKGMITSGELRPGDRLPREADLAHTLGLSRNSLREAVRALSLMRILDVRQGDGTYVASLAADSLLEALNFIVEFHHDDSVLDLLEVRRILEPAATAKAAARMSEDDFAQLSEVLARADDSSPVEALVAADTEFHRRIALGSGNAMLASMIESVAGPTHRARVWRGITQYGALTRTLAEHQEILDALRRRDPELAAIRATVHVAGVEEWLRSTLEQAAPALDGPDVVGQAPGVQAPQAR